MGKEAETETTIEETNQKFIQTGIPKTLQKIIDDNLLTNIPPKKQFFRKVSGRTTLPNNLPPSIRYGEDTISLDFNKKPHYADLFHEFDYPSGQEPIIHDSLTIKYEGENRFSLGVTRQNSRDLSEHQQGKPKLGSSQEIIEHIEKFIFKETGHKLTPPPQPQLNN
jgi:hypothetical protein